MGRRGKQRRQRRAGDAQLARIERRAGKRERASTLMVKVAGGKLEGTQSAEGQTAQIFEGRVNGNDVGWKVSITQPMPLTLDFSGAVDGDAMTGSVQLGMFGSSPFRATRG